MCRLLTRVYFRCGSIDYLKAQCPKDSGDNRSQQGSGRGRSVVLPLMRDRGRGRGGPIQDRGRGGTVSETVDHLIPTAPTRTYSIRDRED